MAIGDVEATDVAPGSETSTPAEPVSLNDDSMVVPPGGKDPVKWKDYMGGYRPAAEMAEREQRVNRALQEGRNLLIQEARKLRGGQPQGQPQPHQPQRTGQQPDPYTDLRSKPFVDGRTVAEMAQRMEREGLAPLTQWAQQVNQAFGALDGRLRQYEQRFGDLDRQRDDAHLRDWVTKTIKDAGYDPDNPHLREDLENFYYSYEPEQGQPRSVLYSEIPKMWTESLQARRGLFRELDKKQAEDARRQARIPTRGGGASPTGPGRYEFESPRQLAKRFFSGRENT